MGSLGVHFALSNGDLRRVLRCAEDGALLELIQEVIEERYLEDGRWAFESDKAWDAIHRVLTGGRLEFDSGPVPLRYCILGGRQLYSGDDYIVSLVDSAQVRDVSVSLRSLDKDWFRQHYERLAETDYDGDVGDEDFEYTWDYFDGLRGFFERAAGASRAVLFTTDQ